MADSQNTLLSWKYLYPIDPRPQAPGVKKKYGQFTPMKSVNNNIKNRNKMKWKDTLARRLSCCVLTPNRGMHVGGRLGLGLSFLTPLIWDIGRRFFSSLQAADKISTSCCFSATQTQRVCENPWATFRLKGRQFKNLYYWWTHCYYILHVS